jgi:RNA polymerase sigma factor (sigma-70 family)
MGELCRAYWFPLYAFARAQGNTPHDAEDLTQSFFLHLLEKEVIARADPAAGKLRSYLLASFRNFMLQTWRKSQSLRKGGNVEILPIDQTGAEARFANAYSTEDPSRLFDRQWALTLLENVAARLRTLHSRRDESAQFEILSPYIGGTPDPGEYAQAAQRLGMTESSVRVAVFRLRKHYRRLLREHILDTVNDPTEIEAELNALFAALSG